jgi:hypothetical protein
VAAKSLLDGAAKGLMVSFSFQGLDKDAKTCTGAYTANKAVMNALANEKIAIAYFFSLEPKIDPDVDKATLPNTGDFQVGGDNIVWHSHGVKYYCVQLSFQCLAIIMMYQSRVCCWNMIGLTWTASIRNPKE